MEDITALRVIYIANVIVAGAVGTISLFFPKVARRRLFQEEETSDSHATYITGSFWYAISIISFIAIFFPIKFSPILIIQVFYKGLFLIRRGIPKLIKRQFHKGLIGLSSFFLVWVIILPIFIPWKYLFD